MKQMIIAAFVTAVLAFSGAWLFIPSESGAALLSGVKHVEVMLAKPGAVDSMAVIDLVPSRYSVGNTLWHELSLRWLAMNRPADGKGDEVLYKAMVAGHGPDAAHAISRGPGMACQIMASAEAFDRPQGPMRLLAAAFPDMPSAWEYILLHEAAHCSWNIALLMEKRLLAAQQNTIFEKLERMQPELNLATHVGEAYADSYAVFMLYKEKPASASEKARGIANWRYATTTSGAVHRTVVSIVCAAKEAESNSGVLTSSRYQDIHEAALYCALMDAHFWLADQGWSTEQIEQQIHSISGLTDLPRDMKNRNEGGEYVAH